MSTYKMPSLRLDGRSLLPIPEGTCDGGDCDRLAVSFAYDERSSALMSGAWDAMLTDEAARLGSRETLPSHQWEQYKARRASGRRPLTNYTKSQWEAFAAGWDARATVQLALDDLTVTELVWELRRGEQSAFWPLLKDDPRVWVDCPADTVHRRGARVLTDRDGYCSDCGYNFMERD